MTSSSDEGNASLRALLRNLTESETEIEKVEDVLVTSLDDLSKNMEIVFEEMRSASVTLKLALLKLVNSFLHTLVDASCFPRHVQVTMEKAEPLVQAALGGISLSGLTSASKVDVLNLGARVKTILEEWRDMKVLSKEISQTPLVQNMLQGKFAEAVEEGKEWTFMQSGDSAEVAATAPSSSSIERSKRKRKGSSPSPGQKKRIRTEEEWSTEAFKKICPPRNEKEISTVLQYMEIHRKKDKSERWEASLRPKDEDPSAEFEELWTRIEEVPPSPSAIVNKAYEREQRLQELRRQVNQEIKDAGGYHGINLSKENTSGGSGDGEGDRQNMYDPEADEDDSSHSRSAEIAPWLLSQKADTSTVIESSTRENVRPHSQYHSSEGQGASFPYEGQQHQQYGAQARHHKPSQQPQQQHPNQYYRSQHRSQHTQEQPQQLHHPHQTQSQSPPFSENQSNHSSSYYPQRLSHSSSNQGANNTYAPYPISSEQRNLLKQTVSPNYESYSQERDSRQICRVPITERDTHDTYQQTYEISPNRIHPSANEAEFDPSFPLPTSAHRVCSSLKQGHGRSRGGRSDHGYRSRASHENTAEPNESYSRGRSTHCNDNQFGQGRSPQSYTAYVSGSHREGADDQGYYAEGSGSAVIQEDLYEEDDEDIEGDLYDPTIFENLDSGQNSHEGRYGGTPVEESSTYRGGGKDHYDVDEIGRDYNNRSSRNSRGSYLDGSRAGPGRSHVGESGNGQGRWYDKNNSTQFSRGGGSQEYHKNREEVRHQFSDSVRKGQGRYRGSGSR